MRRAGAVVFAALLAGCGFQAPAPKVTPPAETQPPPLSTLDAELRLPLADIEKFLNEQTQTQIARLDDKDVRCPFGKCRLDLVATRNGPINVSVTNQRLGLVLPFNIDAQVHIKAPFMQTSGQAKGTGRVTATSRFDISPDWELRSDTRGTITLNRADLRLGPISAELSGFLGNESEAIARPIFKEIDRQIPKWANLKKPVGDAWAKAHRPIQIGKSPEAWLMLAPKHVFVAAPRVENNALLLAMGVAMQARVFVGAKPANMTVPPLPAPEPIRTRPQGRFHLQIPATLPYAEAARLAGQQIDKHPITIAGAIRVRVSELEIIPSRDDVVMAAKLCLAEGWDPFGWFDTCVHGYLRGVPVFNSETDTLRIMNISYDIGTANLLVGSWEALTGSVFTHELEKRLVFDLSDKIGGLKEQIAAALTKGTGGDIAISGGMEHFGSPELSWTKDGFIAAFTAEGTVHIVFQP